MKEHKENALTWEQRYARFGRAFAESPGPIDLIASLWFRLPDNAAYRRWNTLSCSGLRLGGRIGVVTSADLSSREHEQSLWPTSIPAGRIRWQSFPGVGPGSSPETRLLGEVTAY